MRVATVLVFIGFLFNHAHAQTNSNVVLDGANSWILHTPDDGRTSMYVAPGTNGGSWNFSKQTVFNADGSLVFSSYLDLPIGSALGHVITTDKFTYGGNNVGNYSLGWYNEAGVGSPVGYFSGYAGLKMFTGGVTSPRFMIDAAGYTGVGTSAPQAKLHVSGLERLTFRVYRDGDTNNYLSLWQGSGAAGIEPRGTGKLYLGYDQPTEVYVNGKMGVGTSSPNEQLTVQGNIGIPQANFIGYIPSTDKFTYNGVSVGHYTLGWLTEQGAGAPTGYLSGYAGLKFFTNGQPRFFVDNAGNVGIGTTSPNQKLTVNGTIYGKEVKVDLSVPGPDYVFDHNYKLLTLAEVKSYIDTRQHLPEIPSAQEMESNGINVGEMNMLLLKKIEELTLYLIDQNKKLEAQQKQLQEQKKEIEALKKR